MVEPVADLEEHPCDGDDSHAQPDPPLIAGDATLRQHNIAHRLPVRQLQGLPARRGKLIDRDRPLRVRDGVDPVKPAIQVTSSDIIFALRTRWGLQTLLIRVRYLFYSLDGKAVRQLSCSLGVALLQTSPTFPDRSEGMTGAKSHAGM